MGRKNGNAKRSGHKPQMPKRRGGSPRSRQQNHFQYRVFGDTNPNTQSQNQNVAKSELPRVRRVAPTAGFLSLDEINQFGSSVYRKPTFIDLLAEQDVRAALKSGLGLETIARRIDKFRQGRERSLSYMAAAASAHVLPDRRKSSFVVYINPTEETYSRVNEEIQGVPDALGVNTVRRHHRIGIGAFTDEAKADDFAAVFNELVIPTDSEVLLFGAIERYNGSNNHR